MKRSRLRVRGLGTFVGSPGRDSRLAEVENEASPPSSRQDPTFPLGPRFPRFDTPERIELRGSHDATTITQFEGCFVAPTRVPMEVWVGSPPDTNESATPVDPKRGQGAPVKAENEDLTSTGVAPK